MSSDPDAEVPTDVVYPTALEALRTRRSGHNFDSTTDIDDETLRGLIEDATLAPSSYNLQPWEFVTVQDDDGIDEIVDLAYGQEHVREAGTAILVVGHTESETADRVFDEWEEMGRMDEASAEQTKAQTVEM